MEYLVILTLITGAPSTIKVQPVESCQSAQVDFAKNTIAFCIDQKLIETYRKALTPKKYILERLPAE